MKAEQVSVNEVLDEDPVKARKDQNLAQIKNKMEENDLRAIPVVDGENRFKGAIGYRDLIRHIQFKPDQAGIEKVMHQPPEIDSGDNLVELADLRVNSGRKMMVMTEGKKLKGVVGDTEFRNILPEIDELDNITTRNIESNDIETVFEEDTMEEARHRMMDHNISRVPVIDKNGNLTGIIRSTELLKTIVPVEGQNAGGTSGGRSGTREINIAGGNEKDKISAIPSRQLMNRNVFSLEDHMNAKEAAEKLREEEETEIVFVDESYPESIVTVKDFINYLAGFAPGRTIMVNLVGLELPEEKAAVHKKIRNQIRGSLGRKLDRPEELTVRFKKAEKDGKKHRWEIEMRLQSEYGMINIEEEGWEMLEAVDQALNEMNSIVRKKKEKSKP